MSPTRAAAGALLVLLAMSPVAMSPVATSPAAAAPKAKSSEAVWLERIEAGCKADAKKYYSAIHFKKRRQFVKHCVERANR